MNIPNYRHLNETRSDIEMVACDICLKEIPVSEARSCEATDYVIHFCGLECYEKWRTQPDTDAG